MSIRPWGRRQNPNLFAFPDRDKVGNNFDTTSKQRIYPILDGSTAVFVTIGQSRIANNSAPGATPYTPTNGVNAINLNPYDGFFYKAVDPVLGCSASDGYLRSGWQGMLCDELIDDAAFTKVVIVPIAIAGSYIAEWEPGEAYAQRIAAVCAMLTSKGINPTAWLCQIGTSDSVDGTSEASFAASLRAVIAYQRGHSGSSADKWVIARDTIHGSGNATSSGIRAAVASVAGDANNLLGPDIDAVTYPTYSDGTHFNAAGNAQAAALWSTNLQVHF